MEDKLNAVITGGAGFIGSHLTKALLERGFNVHVIDNLSLGKRERVPEGAVFHEVDIREHDKVSSILSSIGDIYCLFHCAAIPMVQFSIDNPEESHDVNVNGTMGILNAARKSSVRKVVYSASCSAYGDQETMPMDEKMLPAPKSPYAMHKYFGELACRVFSEVYGLPTVSLRYFNVYGPGQDPNGNYAMVIAKFLFNSINKKALTITGNGEQTRDFVFIDDVVQANLLAMENQETGKGEVVNIGSGQNTSINEIAEIIGGEISYIEARFEPKDTLADISLAERLLGWKPKITIREGIKILKESI